MVFMGVSEVRLEYGTSYQVSNLFVFIFLCYGTGIESFY